MAQHLRLANTDERPQLPGQFVWTETARNICRSLQLVDSLYKPAMTMISGAPGSGKTSAIKQFEKDTGARIIYTQAAKGEGKIRDFAKNFFDQFLGGTPALSSISQTREMVERYMKSEDIQLNMLIVDEAQYLDQKNTRTGQSAEVFEWLRAASENADFHLVFCGDGSLANIVARYPQLQSRMVRPVVIQNVSSADIAALTDGTPFASHAGQHALHAVAQLAGGLRNVENVIRIATAFAGDAQPTTGHLKAAILDMQLAPRGVKKGGA